jgi:hypothetical protein
MADIDPSYSNINHNHPQRRSVIHGQDSPGTSMLLLSATHQRIPFHLTS